MTTKPYFDTGMVPLVGTKQRTPVRMVVPLSHGESHFHVDNGRGDGVAVSSPVPMVEPWSIYKAPFSSIDDTLMDNGGAKKCAEGRIYSRESSASSPRRVIVVSLNSTW